MKKIMNMQNLLKVSLRSLLSACCIMAIAFSVTPAFAIDSDENWDEWQAIGQGYVARRKVPPNFNKPVSERKSADVADRNAKSVSSAPQGQAVGQFYRSVQAIVADTIDSVWIKTEGEGLFSVSIAELVSLTGHSETDIVKNATRRRLTITNNGDAVRWMYYPDTASIIFVGEKYETFYTDQNAYHLTFGRTSNSKRISISRNTNGPDDGSANAFSETLKFEEEPDMTYGLWSVGTDIDADYWFWDNLYSNFDGKDTLAIPLFVPNPALAGSAQLRVTLRGYTNIHDGDEHEVYAELNGVPVGSSIVWDAFDEVVLTANFDQSLLGEDGDNELVLFSVIDGAQNHSGQWLDQIEIDYARLPVADEGMLLLTDLQKRTDQLVTGFTSDEIIVIQNPNGTPVARRDAAIFEETDGSFSVAFKTKSATEYLVSQVDAMQAVASLEENISSSLLSSSNSADYLIIAPRQFTGTAEALKSLRSSDFSSVEIAWQDDIYDEFSAGRTDPFAITRFLEHVDSNWGYSPAYVVIIGKGSVDHKDRMGYGDSFVPVVMTDTPWALTGSDDRLLNGDEVAGFAIGRIPITNNSQGLGYVEKLTAYASQAGGAHKLQAVLVADNADEAGDFQANSDIVADKLSGYGFTDVTKLYHPQASPSIQNELSDDATWGVGLVSYDGHGNTTQLGSYFEKFLLANADLDTYDSLENDVTDLRNTNFPVFAALTCAAGDFTSPATESVAGALVLNPEGGAIVAYSPTGLSLDADAHIMGNAFVDSLYGSGSTVGEAVTNAKNTSGSVNQFMRRMYSVIGDPAVYAN